jgi:CubicO group peptidase (beta-lactamase class C family)
MRSTSHHRAPSFSAIDAYVRRQMKAARIPGLALGIVHDGHPVHLRGFGRADEGGRAFTPQTPLFIGSNSKSFTALAFMQLAEAGRSIWMHRSSGTSRGSGWLIRRRPR